MGAKTHSRFLAMLLMMMCLLTGNAMAEKKKKSSASGAQEADVEKIKQKYWARGEEATAAVVQNRKFSKRGKFEFGIHWDTIYGDPFLSTNAITGNIGYHFNELYSVHALYGKALVKNSAALDTLERQIGTTANTNEPKFYAIAEGRASILYGKVSLMGQKILHFDAYVSLGAGLMGTESGNNLVIMGGVGQLLHLSQKISLNLSFRMLRYQERIIGKVGGVNGNLGQDLGTRNNLSTMMTIGVTFMFDFFPGKKR